MFNSVGQKYLLVRLWTRTIALHTELCSDVNKAISIKAKAKAKCLQEQDKPPPV